CASASPGLTTSSLRGASQPSNSVVGGSCRTTRSSDCSEKLADRNSRGGRDLGGWWPASNSPLGGEGGAPPGGSKAGTTRPKQEDTHKRDEPQMLLDTGPGVGSQEPSAVPTAPSLEEQWAARIRPHLEAGVAGHIAAGLELIQAKRALKKQRGAS